MNRIFTLLLALLACTAHVSAQTAADTLRAGAAVSGDTLIAVDEQTLVERLAQLLRERRAQHRHNRETADFLRTQLLFNLLDARNTPAQPVVTVPTQSATTQTKTATSDASELYRWQFEQINARLSAIEQRLNGGAPAVRGTTESTVDQSTLETLLRNQQELERQLKKANRTTVVTTPIPVPVAASAANDSRVSDLEKRTRGTTQCTDRPARHVGAQSVGATHECAARSVHRRHGFYRSRACGAANQGRYRGASR